ncbi:alpha-protein kinase 1 isoform X2 [Trachinotus anak]|uniref:alpha-protein kinase 1 isoform X2 n=1 Tax=Trachinotus anak TaxID=443729 RepID=UPI0039F214CD
MVLFGQFPFRAREKVRLGFVRIRYFVVELCSDLHQELGTKVFFCLGLGPKDSLCAELASLLEEAMEMKWPFVPEKWQYKLSVSASDKTNLSDLISKHLPQLLAVLKTSIVAQDAHTALAVVFLVDRFLYWTDESSRLLKITKLLHRCHPDTPVAPQLVVRQARVYLNSGKLQKAEYILSSLINNSGATGCWVYHSESDRALVQAVSVQVRGMILQKLGLWLEAAELIWASLVGYFSLPQPDKKGIGTSLGILANILVSMNDEDFHAFSTNPDIEMSILGDGSHRLLSAAQAAKMAVVYSQYTSLYVLTNVATQGTCLLSYSFLVECPDSQRQSFLLEAREAFAIGLLTKAEGEQVSSKQELHTFLKAAYSLTVTHKWLGTPQEVVTQATQACQKALANFYDYCHADNQDRDSLCAEIMYLVAEVKRLLQVEPFLNSDKRSFMPDSYRDIKDTSVNFTPEAFFKVMQRFQKYHASLCETTNSSCKGARDEIDGARLCITALGTTIGTLNTECCTEACKVLKGIPKGEESHQRGSNSSSLHPPQKPDPSATLGSTDDLGSSWHNFPLSSSGCSWPSSSGYTGSSAIEGGANARNQSCMTTEVDDEKSDSMFQFTDKNKKLDLHGCNSAVSSHTVPRSTIPATFSSNVSSDSEKFELIQAGIETLGTEEAWMTDTAGVAQKLSVTEGPPQSLSQLTLRTTSSSLSDSFGSQSSWEKISADLNSPTNRKPQSKAGTSQSTKSNRSFFHMETLSSETSDSAHDLTDKKHTSGWEFITSSKPQPHESLNVCPNMDTEIDSVSTKPAIKSSLAIPHPNISQCAPTETSTESSFEMLEENQSEHERNEFSSTEKVNVPQRKNPLCYSCLKHSIVCSVVPKQQYLLSQRDYQALLAGICHECLLKRLHSDKIQFKLKEHRTAYSALHLKFSKAKGLWTARETCVYIGESMGIQGSQRAAIWVQFLHQEERLSSYVGKDYLKPKQIQFHLKDVERQMTAQYYVTEFNKSLYDKDVMAQIFFIPSEALLILSGNEIVGCVTVEPYMLGEFVKLTNNAGKKDKRYQATEYGLAFGHFTYLFSDYQEVVVDLQGWVTANGKGLTYLTDPQIHSIKTPKGPSNFAARGLRYFLEDQHGPECNSICQLLKLPPVVRQPHVVPRETLKSC